MTLNEMLLRLHRRLGISTGAQDELLTDLLADANALMLAYLNRAELPAALENAQCQLAVLLYNRLGMEGERARSEGGVTLTVDTLPEDGSARVCLSTASPYKFPADVLGALGIDASGMNGFASMDSLEHVTGTTAPVQLSSLRDAESLHDDVCDRDKMGAFVESACARIFL